MAHEPPTPSDHGRMAVIVDLFQDVGCVLVSAAASYRCGLSPSRDASSHRSRRVGLGLMGSMVSWLVQCTTFGTMPRVHPPMTSGVPVATSDSSASGRRRAPDYFVAALQNLRDTVKWMIAAASVVAGVLVAGLQVKNVGNLTPALRAAMALLAAAVALLLVLALIASAARVLAVPRLSVRDLSARELKAGGSAVRVRLEPLSDNLVQRLLERRTYLLVQHETINEFYRDYIGILGARDKLSRGQLVQRWRPGFRSGQGRRSHCP